jgi:hypothetical protein
MPDTADTPREDARVWAGRIVEGKRPDHERFLEWLAGDDGADLFQRRRLTEYVLYEEGDQLTVVFRAPHTGDPRIMIDFLRYPGAWPDIWQFERGGLPTEDDERETPTRTRRFHWRRADGAA